jgi:hypothetical protein
MVSSRCYVDAYTGDPATATVQRSSQDDSKGSALLTTSCRSTAGPRCPAWERCPARWRSNPCHPVLPADGSPDPPGKSGMNARTHRYGQRAVRDGSPNPSGGRIRWSVFESVDVMALPCAWSGADFPAVPAVGVTCYWPLRRLRTRHRMPATLLILLSTVTRSAASASASATYAASYGHILWRSCQILGSSGAWL